MEFQPEVRCECCYSCPGLNPMGNISDMWSQGHIIQPAVQACQKGSHLNEDMIQYHETVCIVEAVCREGRVEKTLLLFVLTNHIHV